MRFGFLGQHQDGAAGNQRMEGPTAPRIAHPITDPPREMMAEWVEVPAGAASTADPELAHPDASPMVDLEAAIAECRTRVADALYASSKDYKVLCDLANSDLQACDEIAGELRRRLAGNAHYIVLGKLDEAFATAIAKGQIPRA